MTRRFAPDRCSKIRTPNYGQVWTASRVSSPGFCRPQNVLANCTLKHHMWHPASYAPIIPSRQPFWGLADAPRSAAFLRTSANITIGPTPWRRDGLEVVDSSRSIYYQCLHDLQEAWRTWDKQWHFVPKSIYCTFVMCLYFCATGIVFTNSCNQLWRKITIALENVEAPSHVNAADLFFQTGTMRNRKFNNRVQQLLDHLRRIGKTISRVLTSTGFLKFSLI